MKVTPRSATSGRITSRSARFCWSSRCMASPSSGYGSAAADRTAGGGLHLRRRWYPTRAATTCHRSWTASRPTTSACWLLDTRALIDYVAPSPRRRSVMTGLHRSPGPLRRCTRRSWTGGRSSTPAHSAEALAGGLHHLGQLWESGPTSSSTSPSRPKPSCTPTDSPFLPVLPARRLLGFHPGRKPNRHIEARSQPGAAIGMINDDRGSVRTSKKKAEAAHPPGQGNPHLGHLGAR